jgi:hypothetical protein
MSARINEVLTQNTAFQFPEKLMFLLKKWPPCDPESSRFILKKQPHFPQEYSRLTLKKVHPCLPEV